MAWECNSQKKKNPLIAVLLPHTGSLPTEFVQRTWLPLHISIPWANKQTFPCRIPSLPLARNALAKKALETDADYFLWVDSDAIPESPTDPNQSLRMLYECDAPIAACLYVAKQKDGFNYAGWVHAKEGPGYLPIEGWTGNWIKVDVTGMHFCLIKREVFENVPMPWFHWEMEHESSEDFYFFEKAAKEGYKVRIFTDVKFSHIGTLKVRTDKKITTLDV